MFIYTVYITDQIGFRNVGSGSILDFIGTTRSFGTFEPPFYLSEGGNQWTEQ